MTSVYLAYIDPGTGSILLQMLIGSLAGAMIVFRRFLVWPLRAWRSTGKTSNSTAGAAGKGQG